MSERNFLSCGPAQLASRVSTAGGGLAPSLPSPPLQPLLLSSPVLLWAEGSSSDLPKAPSLLPPLIHTHSLSFSPAVGLEGRIVYKEAVEWLL